MQIFDTDISIHNNEIKSINGIRIMIIFDSIYVTPIESD